MDMLLVGSIGLANAAEVFDVAGRKLGAYVQRIPDGETGERAGWLEWLEPNFAGNPALEATASKGDWRNATAPAANRDTTWYRLKSAQAARGLTFPEIGYARHAIASFEKFEQARSAGAVPPHVKFMIAIATPFCAVHRFGAEANKAEIEAAYEAGILAEVASIAATLPHERIAIQWDCAHDMQAYDGARDIWFEDRHRGIEDRLARLGDSVPASIELGYHFCYGSFGGKHFVEPRDTGAMVNLANAILPRIGRPVAWLHMPVPVERDDEAYFAPLAQLKLPEHTKLYLGLVHDTDGEEGARRRMSAANRFAQGYGIATECGFGRRDPKSIGALLDLHARLAAQ
ncbi:MAG: hypothetical protein AB7F96_07410 [Beijerinckiaceae bacterium]